jgi:S-formylglutathione hydrolase FrmB
LTLALLLFAALCATAATSLQFGVTIQPDLVSSPQTGRLFVILARADKPEPRTTLTRAGLDAPYTLARDVISLAPGATALLDRTAFTFPITNLSDLPAADYFVQALLDSNRDLRSPNSPGNLYSGVRKLHLDPAHPDAIKLNLNHQIPPEQLPPDTAQIKFIKIQSRLLSDFHHRPIYLRAGVILPRNYARDAARQFPLWVRIGGLNARYTSVNNLMGAKSDFRKAWQAKDAPQFILLQLDGAGPFGDPYQVNSANSGPYGDAITQELIPYVEQMFRAIGTPHSRVLSGLSTGGWASLALQVFYPDFFNGTWTFCPDGVDFRAFELVNIYEDANAYTNQFGFERPSDRTVTGDVRLTMRREVGVENLLGSGNNWILSGEQWGDWNATYGPRGSDGRPVPLWDPQTGVINHDIAQQWKQYDLRLVMEQNWKTLGPKLRGKLHISVGDADNYFLNNAVHLLDDFLSHADPPYQGRIVYGPGKGHGWMDITIADLMQEMSAATSESSSPAK